VCIDDARHHEQARRIDPVPRGTSTWHRRRDLPPWMTTSLSIVPS
jgi:hypothetical protein